LKYQVRQQREKALPLFKEAASLDPESKIMMRRENGEEVSCREMADYQYARTFLVTWGTIEPDHLEKFVRDHPSGRLTKDAYLDLALGTRLNDEEGAATFYKLFAMCPHDPEVLESYVAQVQRYQDQSDAKNTLDRGLEFAESTVDVLKKNDLNRAALNLAELRLLKGDPVKAEDAYGPEFIASQIRSWAEALMNYAEFWNVKNRNLENAEAAVTLALAMRPAEASFRRAAARFYLFPPGKPDKALEVYGPGFVKSLENDPAELYEYFSFWLARKMNAESALSALETLLRLRPESVHYRSSAASALIKAGYPERALAVFGPDFIARYAGEHSVLYDYGSFWVNRNSNLESAVPALVKAASESPRTWADQYRAVTALDKANRPEAVFSVFGPSYLPHIKDDPLALCQYARFWLGKNTNKDSALEALDAAVRLPSLTWADRMSAAIGYLTAGRPDRAEEVYGPAYMKSIAGNARALTNYAMFWKRMGKNLNSALEAARSACDLAKDNSDSWATMAELLLLDGKPGEALTAIEKALSLTKSKDSISRYESVRKQIKDALAKKQS
ncbi:MAG: hypothetical protein MUP52_13005, partial [Candidatus Aminicenantes bacterium]|nr:hypothetical protein [Candidatus Aminicenantes bacterium]